jgi:hypothetical protein
MRVHADPDPRSDATNSDRISISNPRRTGSIGCFRVEMKTGLFAISVADPDPGSGAFLTPGSGIRNGFIPDLGSRIPSPYF